MSKFEQQTNIRDNRRLSWKLIDARNESALTEISKHIIELHNWIMGEHASKQELSFIVKMYIESLRRYMKRK